MTHISCHAACCPGRGGRNEHHSLFDTRLRWQRDPYRYTTHTIRDLLVRDFTKYLLLVRNGTCLQDTPQPRRRLRVLRAARNAVIQGIRFLAVYCIGTALQSLTERSRTRMVARMDGEAQVGARCTCNDGFWQRC